MIINDVTKVQAINTVLHNNSANVVNINWNSVHWVNNDASRTFADFPNLTTVSNIGNTVEKLYQTFYNCRQLVNAPDIPASVTNMLQTFQNCTSLVVAPNIANGPTVLESTFKGCTSLVNVTLPESVTHLTYTFQDCKSLTTPPVIPNSVTNMQYTFGYCSNLTTAPTLPNNVQSLYATFIEVPITEVPTIPNSVTNMGMTFRATNIINAPEIHNGVKDMTQTFHYCYDLVNAPTIIPESVNRFEWCFAGSNKITTAPIIKGKDIESLYGSFDGCTSLTGDLYIYSENISNIQRAFQGTHLNAIYVPFNNAGINTITYNTFIAAGYTVLDINQPAEKEVDLTGFTYTIDENNVATLTGLDMADKSSVTLPNVN